MAARNTIRYLLYKDLEYNRSYVYDVPLADVMWVAKVRGEFLNLNGKPFSKF